MKPRLAVTIGDPAGIGPEVAAKALPEALAFSRPILIGPESLWREAVSRYAPAVAPRLGDSIAIFDVPIPQSAILNPRSRGLIQADCVREAVAMVLRGEADAVVTAPIAKSNFEAADLPFPGHTELLAELAGVKTVVMMLAGPRLRVVPLTTHLALRDVPDLITADLIERQVRVIDADLRRWFGLSKPRIALCGLNPHAGEGGMFGREEIDVLAPAVERLRAEGIDVSGPHSADTVFHFAAAGRYDVVVAPTHDQALIPLKLLHFGEAVNITLGLPFPRTSPDHGTAPDIAGRGEASPASMIAALRTASAMCALGIRPSHERE